MYCDATAVLRLTLYTNKVKSQVYIEERKYTNAENQECNMLSDADNDEGFFSGGMNRCK